MNNISKLISLLGGTGAVAERLKIRPSAISNWKKLDKIPSAKLEAILELSSYLDVNVESFFPSKKLNNLKFKMLLIICGGIASYKSLEIIRLIKKTDIELDVVMTKSAQKFITPLLVTSLNEKKCYVDLFSLEDETKMNHINLARNPDLILVAPATANIMAKFANGLADDLASTILLASFSKIIFAPSMNPVMWNNLATQENYKTLLNRGIKFIEPDTGDMACGESGTGRFPEPKAIYEFIFSYIKESQILSNQFKEISIVVTAGPTVEAIDPVRFVSNNSSGKQGFEIASELTKRGAKVTVISGPVSIPFPNCEKVIKVKTAQEMFNSVTEQLPADILICCAAVADWKLIPKNLTNNIMDLNTKIKKTNKNLLFETVENPDILETIAKSNLRPKIVIGFSAETNNIKKNAHSKLISKNVDLMIANDVSNNKVFGEDFNEVCFIYKNYYEQLEKQSKKSVAYHLANRINDLLVKQSKRGVNA